MIDIGHSGREARRRWPVGPDDFDELVKTKEFTNGADCKEVKKLYRKMSIAQLGSVRVLDFSEMPRPTIDDCKRLAGALNLCTSAEVLRLVRSPLTVSHSSYCVLEHTYFVQVRVRADFMCLDDECCDTICKHLQDKALPMLQILQLGDNSIEDFGALSLAQAFERGCLPLVSSLSLANNLIGDAGIRALTSAARSGVMENMVTLDLASNKIGARGMLELMWALHDPETWLKCQVRASGVRVRFAGCAITAYDHPSCKRPISS